MKAALEDVLTGRARTVMLVGEPGIGKTRTAQELATHDMALGYHAIWGRCYSAQGAPPYWPWVQAVRTYIREHSPEELRTQMGAGAADIAEVVPEVREQLPGLESPPSLEPQQARFRFFDSMAAFLMRASEAQPLLLLLAVAGAWMLGGGEIYSGLAARSAVRMADPSQTDVRGYFLFGVAYDTASLSCTLPIFLIVVGTSLAVSDILTTLGQFLLYALGMGMVIMALTIGIALFKGAMVRGLRRALPYIQPVGSLLMILAGSYIVFYWLTLGELM